MAKVQEQHGDKTSPICEDTAFMLENIYPLRNDISAEDLTEQPPGDQPINVLFTAQDMCAFDSSSWDFEVFLSGFETIFGETIIEALRPVFGEEIEITPAPLSAQVRSNFLLTLLKLANSPLKVSVAFHGTNPSNFESIYQQGLLIPGVGNTLEVVNGSTYGRGIYTANANASWLSARFCIGTPKMLVCAVLQTPSVFHVDDAQIIFDANHIVPLLVASGRELKSDIAHSRSPLPEPCLVPLVMLMGQIARFKEADDIGEALKQLGYTTVDLRRYGATVKVLKRLGFEAFELQDAGYTDFDLHFAGYPVKCRNMLHNDIPVCPPEAKDKKIHPVHGTLTFVELQKLVPPARCEATWARMRSAA